MWHNVTLRHGGVTIVAVGAQQWILLLFSLYITNGTVFWKKIFKTEVIVWTFCKTFVWEVLRKIQRDIAINVQWLSGKLLVIAINVQRLSGKVLVIAVNVQWLSGKVLVIAINVQWLSGKVLVIAINVQWLSGKVLAILVRVRSDMNVLDNLRKILKYNISWRSVHLEQSCSKWTDRHDEVYVAVSNISNGHNSALTQRFSTARPRPGTGTWHQLHRAARGSPGIDN